MNAIDLSSPMTVAEAKVIVFAAGLTADSLFIDIQHALLDEVAEECPIRDDEDEDEHIDRIYRRAERLALAIIA